MRTALLLGTLFFFCCLLSGIAYVGARPDTCAQDSDSGGDSRKREQLREKLLSGQAEKIAQAREEILADRAETIKILIEIVKDKKLQENNKLTVQAAVLLLADLRAEEAILHLLDILLFDIQGWYKDKGEGGIDIPLIGRPLIVEGLVRIGLPSVKPATEKLLSIDENTPNPGHTQGFCWWVVEDILGARLAEQYFSFLAEKYPEDSKERKQLKKASDQMHREYEIEESLKEKNADATDEENENNKKKPEESTPAEPGDTPAETPGD